MLGLSARDRCTLVPVLPGGVLAPDAAAADGAAATAAARYASLPGLQPLAYQLEALLHRAGARPHRPHWDEWAPAWRAEQRDGAR